MSTRDTTAWRFYFICFILLSAVAAIVWRMVDLNILDSQFLRNQGNVRMLRTISIPAYRGMITDRNGRALAISTPVDSIWINPQKFNPKHRQLQRLAHLLKLSKHKITQRAATKKSGREFIYLKRHVNPHLANKIRKLGIAGVHFQREYRRYYPEANVVAHVVGFTNIDDIGQEGLELAYNDWLEGLPGRERVVKDRLGHVVSVVNEIRKPRPGKDLVLSLDRRIQYLAYRDLKQAVKKYKAKSGSVVVLDVNTGEVIAMANVPSYNPNNRPKIHDGRYRNRAVTDVFEPGSTIKAFSVVNALASGKYQPNSEVNTAPGWMILDGSEVHDEENNGRLSVTQILQRSSNMGVTKLTLSLPKNSLWELLHKVGFGQITQSHFPGESAGILDPTDDWNDFQIATLSFGYALSVTALQLARAYGILAAGGVARPVTFLKLNEPPVGKRVISRKVAAEVRTMMESVIAQGGTATRAKVPGYRVTGKTGTVRMVGRHGYEKNHHIGIFVGMAPASKPQLVIAVVIKDPQGGVYYGGLVAAPVFAKVMGGALRMLDIPPDQLSTLVVKR